MQPSSLLSRDVTEELRRYDEHLSDVRGLAEGTRHKLALIIGRLLRRKFADRPIDIVKLRPEDIRRFLAGQQGVSRSPSNASQLASALRSYFRYRTTCGDQVGELTTVISNPVHWKLAIFISCQGGRDQPISSMAIQKVIKRAGRRIGLTHFSAHALRQTLACRLVENGSSLKESQMYCGTVR